MGRFRLSRLGLACSECGRLSILEPPAAVVVDSGLLLEGQSAEIRTIYSALLDYAAGTGVTPWEAAYRLLSNALRVESP